MFVSASLIFPLLVCKLSLYTKDVQQGQTEERQAYSILVDARSKKVGNSLTRLVLGAAGELDLFAYLPEV